MEKNLHGKTYGSGFAKEPVKNDWNPSPVILVQKIINPLYCCRGGIAEGAFRNCKLSFQGYSESVHNLFILG